MDLKYDKCDLADFNINFKVRLQKDYRINDRPPFFQIPSVENKNWGGFVKTSVCIWGGFRTISRIPN